MADLEAEKAHAAARAVDEVRDGMLVGLGSGTTAAYAVRALAARVQAGLRVTTTATSTSTEALASSLGLAPLPLDRIAKIDLTIDGADEVDARFRAIKGGGGALLREKVVASASERVIVIVDSSKPVQVLGRAKLPLEVFPFAEAVVGRKLAELGAPFVRRTRTDGSTYLTDQSSLILDLGLGAIPDPDGLASRLRSIPGLVEHGLFLTEIDVVMVGEGAEVRVLERGEGGEK